MKLSIAASIFLAQAYGRSKNRLLNLHETGYDHSHLSNDSCDNKDMLYELDNRNLGCEAYEGAGIRDCGLYDDFDFVASSLCCACGGGLREDVQVSGWGVLDPSLVG